MRLDLRPHQSEALAAVNTALAHSPRATVVMACGSGKTLLGLRVAADADRVLLLEPSLALIRQSLEHARADGLLKGRTVICVCSDPKISGDDQWHITDEEIGVPVTTDTRTLRGLLQRAGSRCAVFCTYHSQALLRAAMPRRFDFDLAIFDEAHRTAGTRGRAFGIALSDDRIRITKRLFLTATPRLFAEGVDDLRETAYSMDDPDVYGPRVYELPLVDAIARGIVCDYQVLTACVTGSEVQDALAQAQNLFLPRGQLPIELVAGQIAVCKAIDVTGARRVITFHQTIQEAAAFSRDEAGTYRQANVKPFHIHGRMPAAQRELVIGAFLGADQPSVLTNCRCLTEGVDVPEIDMVAFISRRESLIDVVQATGRALRTKPGKECGYVMLPIYIPEDQPIEAALDRSEMAVTWEILHAVLESDGVLTQRMQGTGDRSGAEAAAFLHHRRRGHLRVVAPHDLLEDLQRAITMRRIHRLSQRWDVMADLAARYSERERHLAVPPNHIEDGLPLGSWIGRQRLLRKRGRLPPYRYDRLTELGMVWAVGKAEREEQAEARWRERLVLTRQHVAKHGPWEHSRRLATPDLLLWAKLARRALTLGNLSDEKRDALQALGIQPNPRLNDEARIEQLRRWRSIHPEGRPPRTGPDRKLAFLLSNLAERFRHNNLDRSVVEQLATMGFELRRDGPKRLTAFHKFGERSWNMHFQALKSYLSQNGWQTLWRTKVHDGLALDGWVAYQRRQKREGLLSAERIAALESLGIQWAKKSEWWVDYVRQIKEFRALHGHQRLPTTSEFQVLRNKVSILRTRLARGTLPPALVATLDSIRFARTAEDEFWEFMMSTLKAWVAQHGPDALERRDLPTQLRNFLFNRKRWYRNGKLTGDQVAQLRAHGVRWAVAADTHHIMIRRLADLSRTFGKDNVEAVALRESDINEWLTVQLELAARAALPSEVADDLRRVGINLDIQMPSQGEAVN